MSSDASALARYSGGSVISGKYRLDGMLGEGGMGSVWRAFNLQLETPVAIKLLRDDLQTRELADRLRSEARSAAKLVHPSIVRIFDVGESETGDPYVVMELLNGETLGSVLDRGALPAERALQLLLPVAEALSLAHSHGLVHRDVKPDNIFIADTAGVMQPKLLDFGIAKVMSARKSKTSNTLGGTLVGSPDYMSPEQARGCADVDERADVWAFCVVLYEALAGRPPFRGETYPAVLASVIVDAPPPLEGVDPELAALVMRGLAKDREERPASIFELGQLLAAWLCRQGTTVDVTGSLLSGRWLEHLNEQPVQAQWRSTPRQELEPSTFISVVHPGPHPNSHSGTSMFRARVRPRFWPAAAAVFAVLLGIGGWAAVHSYPSVLTGIAAGVGVNLPDATRAEAPPSALVPPPPALAPTEVSIPPNPVLAAEPAKPPEPAVPVSKPRAPVPPPAAWFKRAPTTTRSASQRVIAAPTQTGPYPPYDPGI